VKACSQRGSGIAVGNGQVANRRAALKVEKGASWTRQEVTRISQDAAVGAANEPRDDAPERSSGGKEKQ